MMKPKIFRAEFWRTGLYALIFADEHIKESVHEDLKKFLYYSKLNTRRL